MIPTTKLEKMEQEFPFLKSFLDKNFGAFLKDEKTELEIKVKRIGPDVLYFKGDFLDGHNSRWLKEEQYGSGWTSVFCIDRNNQVTWVKFGELSYDKLRNYLTVKHSKTKFIVITETKTWYDYEWNYDNDGERESVNTFKHFAKRTIQMTIHKCQGNELKDLIYDEQLITKVHLTNKLWTDLAIKDVHKPSKEYKIIEERLDKMTKKFKTFFEKYLQADMYTERAFNFEIDENIKFLSFSCAGRLIITLDTKHDQISYIALDEKEVDWNMGVKSIDATLDRAEEITDKVILKCLEKFEEGKNFKEVFKIGQIGFAGHVFGTPAEPAEAEK